MNVWSKYRVEFGTSSGLMGAYVGDTIAELHNAIDSDLRLIPYTKTHDLANTLKYGYFNEFKNSLYKTTDYVIDNCIHFMWTVK